MNKFKIYFISFVIVIIFFINIFNSIITQNIYSKKLSTNLQTRYYPLEMCNDIIDFKIKNLKNIIIGDSHVYSGITLEKLNNSFEGLSLLCSLPKIRFEDNISFIQFLDKNNNLDLIVVGLSPFQFMTSNKEEEIERINLYKNLIEINPYSFRFNTIKRYIKHFISPVSELKIAKQQNFFLANSNMSFFDKYNARLDRKIYNQVKNRYNYFNVDEEKNIKTINFLCNKISIKAKLVFIDIPTAEYFDNNFIFINKYKNYLDKIKSCHTVIKSPETNNFSNKINFFDRGGVLLNKVNPYKYAETNNQFINFYDLTHFNYAGSLKYTNFLIKELKKIKNNY